jgi:4-hydroxy-tetrahydrodipicolinate reductase
MVIGTTGHSEAFLQQLAADCKSKGVGAVVAPNFAIGAVLMIHLAKIAAKYFDYAEIIESHQEKKLDAPSGTAVMFARELVEARGKPFEHTMPEFIPGVMLAAREVVKHNELIFGLDALIGL